MSDQKTPFRRRIAPAIPFILNVEDANGDVQKISFQISFDMNAFSAVEDITGLSMLSNIQQIWQRPKVSTVTAMFWAGIQENHADEFEGPDGLKRLRQLVTFGEVKNVLAALNKAFLLQLPKERREAIEARAAAAERGETPVPLA